MGTGPGALTDAVAVVTGAGRMRSIGRAVALELARAGCHVVVTGSEGGAAPRTDEERAAHWRGAASVADEVRALGRRATACAVDVGDESSVDALWDTVFDRHGRVDVLVNNAAAPRGADRVALTDLDPAVFDRVMQTNVRGTFLMSRRCAQRMVEQGDGGAIINISSIAGKLGSPQAAAYAASKAAVQSLTVSAARELAADRVRVNALCPGIVATGRLNGASDADWQRSIAAMVPLGTAGQPQDIAWAAAYLAGEQGRWITGQAWNIDGGQLTVR
ncbi:SDR family NAD(P)-dependent oxidoreductase [Tomitella cavernea]|uniref:3-oxoacyl-[acyl-carrier-protein] reductase n=1 Tax=Tomitella cavernea TaxID=1387982 RepID=A0ABP9C6S4_9ACTN|nr:SDR family oxidoreductase [Tomitella cavernea]